MPNRPKALVVEDDRTTAKAAHRVLTDAGYHVFIQGSVTGAKCAMLVARYHLLVVDVNIPERHAEPDSAGDGLAFVEQVRRVDADTRIIVWSANTGPTISWRAFDLSARFIPKDERALERLADLARFWSPPGRVGHVEHVEHEPEQKQERRNAHREGDEF